MRRKEYDQAVAILLKDKYPRYAWDSGDELKTAKQLEERFPEQIQEEALDQIRALHGRIENTDKKDIAAELGNILKTLDYKLS